jgi:hypothetical protein
MDCRDIFRMIDAEEMSIAEFKAALERWCTPMKGQGGASAE